MPAAAVTPAPVAYIKVVAVKKLVVGFLVLTSSRASGVVTIVVFSDDGGDCTICVVWPSDHPSVRTQLLLTEWRRNPDLLL